MIGPNSGKMNNCVIAIDGFSSCGKSTLAKQLADKLGFIYVDSGAMYRAITLHFIETNVDISNETEIEASLNNAKIRFSQTTLDTRVFLNDRDVSQEIRDLFIATKVSKISPIPAVRRSLVSQQQSMGLTQNIIMDGRDIGTQVFPYAPIKLFMTADPKTRAARRYIELSKHNPDITLEEVYVNLAQRDYDDTTREESPLMCASDAITIDNTTLTMDQQFDLALDIIKSKVPHFIFAGL